MFVRMMFERFFSPPWSWLWNFFSLFWLLPVCIIEYLNICIIDLGLLFELWMSCGTGSVALSWIEKTEKLDNINRKPENLIRIRLAASMVAPSWLHYKYCSIRNIRKQTFWLLLLGLTSYWTIHTICTMHNIYLLVRSVRPSIYFVWKTLKHASQ